MFEEEVTGGTPVPPMDLSIVIPTWNGISLLKEFLPPLLREAASYRDGGHGEAEIIVVDDASGDGTREYLNGNSVRVVARTEQGGFSAACNSGLAVARFSVTVLLNNDVRVAAGFLASLVRPFSDPGVFAATARVFEPARGWLATSGKIGSFRRGFWSVYFNYDTAAGGVEATESLSMYAVGGFCAFRTEPAREWGGFDEMFSPFHWEDIDLSYRAWKRGWKVVFVREAVAWHQASSTIGSAFRSRDVEAVAVRNRLLFHWKNLHDPGMLLQHLGMLGLLLLSRWMAGDLLFYRAFWNALKLLPACRRSRQLEKAASKRGDRQVRRLLHEFAQRRDVEIFRSQLEVEQRYHERLRGPDHSQ